MNVQIDLRINTLTHWHIGEFRVMLGVRVSCPEKERSVRNGYEGVIIGCGRCFLEWRRMVW